MEMVQSRVKLAENTATGEMVAIKIFDKEKIKKQNLSEQIKLEISIMNKLKHPNLVNLIEVLGCKSKVSHDHVLVLPSDLYRNRIRS